MTGYVIKRVSDGEFFDGYEWSASLLDAKIYDSVGFGTAVDIEHFGLVIPPYFPQNWESLWMKNKNKYKVVEIEIREV